MSHDISGDYTSVEIVPNDSVQTESTPIQIVSTDVETPTASRVPVEVVVHGQDELNIDSDELESVDPLTVDPAEEVAILLGEKSASASDAKSSDVEAEFVANSNTVSSDEAVSVDEPVSMDEPVSSDEPVSMDEVVSETKSVSTESVSESPIAELSTPEKESIPADIEQQFEALDTNEFAEMGLSPDVMEAIDTAGYDTPSPIQSETVPYILEGRDLMGQAETGSGKTAAFAWPLLSKIDTKLAKPQVLVLAPTRELAIQVTAAFEKYARGMDGFRAVTIYGGQSYETQLRALSRGVHVVVGTPGRVMDHLRRKTLDLRNLKTLVLDEADEMLRMGFIDDVEWILEQVPAKRQILSFSATLPPPIQRIAKRHLKDPAHVTIKSKTATADSINQSCVFLHAREKMERLIRILETEETDGVLVFVKTRASTVVVSEGLIRKGIIASALNGDIPQNQRERTVNQLKSGRINVVVATDVAARGLDVQRISHVINYDFPHDTEAYVHRIGRTGRAGRTGNAILFVEPKEKGKLGRLQHATNQRVDPFKQKSIDEINSVRVEKFKQRVIEATEGKQIKFYSDLISELQNETEIPFEQIAGALAVLAQGETPLLLQELSNKKSNWKKDGNQRGERQERGPMTTFRVEVGREHGVGPGNIVGAVTNEANLSNGEIGRINIFDKFSTIDLPTDMPQNVIDHLKHVHVSGQRLDISKSDRTYAKPGGRKSGPSHSRGARSDGGKRYGDKKFGDKKYGDKKFADKKYGDKKYGDKKFADKSFRNEKPNDRREGANSENKSFEKKPFERKPSESKFGDKKPFERTTSENKSFEKKPFRKSSENKSFEKKPFERKPPEHKFSDKKPAKRKSNDSGQRTELGEKRDRYAREDGSRYASSGSKFSKSKPKATPKTKAAERTKAKRKPGAKPSNPMKKYVKIRSAK